MGKISVALCTYNGLPYLPEQIESILNQSRLPDEIVVFDDNSSDGTTEILEDYSNEYPEVFDIHFNDENRGVVKNFEESIRACNGDLIALADQDDIWSEDKLRRQEAVFQESDSLLAFHNSTITDEDLNPISDLWTELSYTPGRLRNPQAAIIELVKRNVVQGATMCFKSELVSEVLPIPSFWSHDYYIALIAALRGQVYDIDESLLYYRQHERQVTGVGPNFKDRWISAVQNGQEFHQRQEAAWKQVLADISSYKDVELSVDRSYAESIVSRRAEFEEARANIWDSSIPIRKRIHSLGREAWSGAYSEYANGGISLFKDSMALLMTLREG